MRAVSLGTSVMLQALFVVSHGAEFNCKNSMISDEWREKVLNVQNVNRQRLAQGKLVGKDNKLLPVAKDINWLIWDCPLEDAAYDLAVKCAEPVAAPAGHGAVAKMITAKSKPCNTTTTAVQAVKEIWKAGLAKQETQAKVADNNDFSQMAYSKTNGVGCSYNWCTGKLFLVCLYNQDGAAQAITDLYTNGAAGETCETCAATNTCVEWLCEVPITPGKDFI
ncbi:SCP-like protein [Ancylostoma caninum]|uniref:SCP-like protein n=1 Tax=Ancylostoma caninum TaxID=29170 RepID=A0A368GNC1_ANCCA|nr:SCP-like protein [Ancylostoma caninum]